MTSAETLAAKVLETGCLEGLPAGHFIDGSFTSATNNKTLESFDPGRAKAFAVFAAGSIEDVDQAVESSKRAFENTWRDTAPVERARILLKTSALILENLDRLAVAETLDSGKPLQEALGDVRGAARTFEYYAGACDKLQGDSFPLAGDYIGYSIHEPVGVTAHIIPWNFPISTAARGFAPALAAGCTVVAKPAEQTPFTALMLAKILFDAGLPSGVCNVITGLGAEVGAPLSRHSSVDHITFTGSVQTGRAVMTAAAEEITRVVLELGGKSPVVVLNDANRAQAINGVIGAIYENAGQICSAGSRLVIERGIHAGFVEELVDRVKALRIGHGLTQPDLGPVNSAAHLEKISGFVERARLGGATIATGGSVTEDPSTGGGWFYEATIIDQAQPEDEVVREEIFGPVLTVQVAEDAEHALTLANDCQYGLVAGIYTENFGQAHQLAKRIDAGQIYINEYFAGGIEVPFGGNKKSGFGREKGLEGVRSYCKTKSIAAKIA
ncbi:aldehyde dehydrogenase (acceptor) [Roseibium hamelinense]|uniref:Aldehyde dehydrogenase (Acceptor) n=1 Tax=Roseibium hamelinense TaxID=150831 RepID=A0A562SZ34_9HYPH|nr:aldehyde dehydrogenase family protein [Roseibium hamelinense]MTI44792.1 aldehyde dehydrogenase family protein [Roseibium hamelinense]TWI86016.1 aldehyde dehydrogenase (acceptor) [Roseibium hamelinense]